MGGIYLDTDVEILSADPSEKYLHNTSVFAFKNSRSINTGLIYMSEKKNSFTQKLVDEYDTSIMDSKLKTNTEMNRKHFEQEYLKLCWDGTSQQLENSYFIGVKEYSEIMRYYGTRSWLDVSYVIKKGKVRERVKQILRNPDIFNIIERVVGRRMILMYTLLVYDF